MIDVNKAMKVRLVDTEDARQWMRATLEWFAMAPVRPGNEEATEEQLRDRIWNDLYGEFRKPVTELISLGDAWINSPNVPWHDVESYRKAREKLMTLLHGGRE